MLRVLISAALAFALQTSSMDDSGFNLLSHVPVRVSAFLEVAFCFTVEVRNPEAFLADCLIPTQDADDNIRVVAADRLTKAHLLDLHADSRGLVSFEMFLGF